jgi:hypothetical protein
MARASGRAFTPSCLPSGSIRRTSRARMRSFTRWSFRSVAVAIRCSPSYGRGRAFGTCVVEAGSDGGNVLSPPICCVALGARSARLLRALDKMVTAVSAAHAAELRNYALHFGRPGQLDRARQLCHLDRDRREDLAAAAPGQASTAPLAASAGVVQECRQWVAIFWLTERRLMAGTLLTVCDPYALPGFYCPYDACLPISS